MQDIGSYVQELRDGKNSVDLKGHIVQKWQFCHHLLIHAIPNLQNTNGAFILINIYIGGYKWHKKMHH